MNKIILLLATLFSFCAASLAQAANEKIIFVIDSVPLINNPEDWNEILDTDIADITVIKNKDSVKLLGFKRFDVVTYIFTKEYRNRPDSIKQIPSLIQMKMEDEVWNFNNIPYTGKYINYYNSGRKQSEGTMLNGKLHGEVKVYFQNGTVGSVKNYENGIANGKQIEYYKNGALRQKRELKEGRDEGVWETYFPDGQTERMVTVKNGKVVDTVAVYYSTGKINKNLVSSQNVLYLQQQVYQSLREGNTKAALKFCKKIIDLDSTNTDAHLCMGMAMLTDLRFYEAIAEFDKLLVIEPLMQQALQQRAMARIRKYEFENSRAISKSNNVTVTATNNVDTMQEKDKEKICADLLRVDLLQTINLYGYLRSVTDALLKYCQIDVRR
jgi:antitoxin component YwqK of YwqJK toxin-antitoxin module